MNINKINHDSLLKKILYRKDGSIISSRIRSINNRYPNIKRYIQSRYDDNIIKELEKYNGGYLIIF